MANTPGATANHKEKPPRSPFLTEDSFSPEQLADVSLFDPLMSPDRPESPFQSVYEMEGHDRVSSPDAEEFVDFLAELHDDEFNEAIVDFVDEATDFILNQSELQFGRELHKKRDIDQLLIERFAPALREVDSSFDRLGAVFDRPDIEVMGETEFDHLLEQIDPEDEAPPPEIERFGLGGLLKKVKDKAKKAAKKAWKKGKSAAKRLGRAAFRLAINRLKRIARQFLMHVLERAMERIPPKYRPLAQIVADKLGIKTSEIEPQEIPGTPEASMIDPAEMQRSFDIEIASLVLEPDRREQERIHAQYMSASQGKPEDPMTDLRRARAKFVSRVGELTENDDPGPDVEEFVQAVLTAAKWAIRIIGEKRTERYLGNQIAKILRRWVKKDKARALGLIIADIGVEIIKRTGKGEVTADFEETLGASALAQVVEDTVHGVARLPRHVLENEELLEGYVIEVFEEAARANLPDVLSPEVYRKRPELRESCKTNGVWIAMPSKFYKKYTHIFDTRICPHAAQQLKSFGGVPLSTILRDHYGLSLGSGIRARAHLYEAMAGGRLFHIAKLERDIQGFAASPRVAWSQIHPLSTFAASILTGEPSLGRDVAPRYLMGQDIISDGQRFYHLEIEGAQPLTTISAEGLRALRRSSELNITMRTPNNQLQLFLFLSEADAQEISEKLRQGSAIGSVLRLVVSMIGAGLSRIFGNGMYRHMKVVHPATMVPGGTDGRALRRLSPMVTDMLVEKILEWAGQALPDFIKGRREDLIVAANERSDGVTIGLTMNNAPGLAIIRELLMGGGAPLRGSWFPDGAPDVKVMLYPGFHRG